MLLALILAQLFNTCPAGEPLFTAHVAGVKANFFRHVVCKEPPYGTSTAREWAYYWDQLGGSPTTAVGNQGFCNEPTDEGRMTRLREWACSGGLTRHRSRSRIPDGRVVFTVRCNGESVSQAHLVCLPQEEAPR